MPKTAAALPATNDAIALLTTALREGHQVTLSLTTPPRVIRPPSMVVACCLTLGLTPSQARILVALMEHGFVAKPDLHGLMSDGKGASNINTLKVVIHQMRQRLEAHNVRITVVWKSGYRLDEESRNKLREMLTEATNDDTKTET